MSTPLRITTCLSTLNDEARELNMNDFKVKVTACLNHGLRVVVENDDYTCMLGYSDDEGNCERTFPYTEEGLQNLKRCMAKATKDLLKLKKGEGEDNASELHVPNDLEMSDDYVHQKLQELLQGFEKARRSVPEGCVHDGSKPTDAEKERKTGPENSVWVPARYEAYVYPSLGRKHFGLKVFMDDIDDRHFIRHNMYFPANPEGIHEAVKTSVNMFSAGVDNINQQTK